MVLPSPTSSASRTRPRNCLSTLRTVSIWCKQRLDTGQVRQAQELVEALGKAEMREAFAQAEPAAVALGLAAIRGRQRRQIDLDCERNFDVDARQGRRSGHRRDGGRGMPVTRRRRSALASLRFDLCPGLGLGLGFGLDRRRRLGAQGRALNEWQRPGGQDDLEVPFQPSCAGAPARESPDCRRPGGQAVTLKHHPRCRGLVGLAQRQGPQQVRSGRRRAPLEPIEKVQRPLRPLVEQGGGGRHQENDRVARAFLDRLFSEPKEARMQAAIREGGVEPVHPRVRRLRRVFEQLRLAQCHGLRRPIRRSRPPLPKALKCQSGPRRNRATPANHGPTQTCSQWPGVAAIPYCG